MKTIIAGKAKRENHKETAALAQAEAPLILKVEQERRYIVKMRKILLLLMFISAIALVAANAQSDIRPTTLHSLPPDEKASVIRFDCPTQVGVGVINLPQGWFSFAARTFQYNSLSLTVNNNKTTIVCQYGKQSDHLIAREVASNYVCKEVNSRTVECRLKIGLTKK